MHKEIVLIEWLDSKGANGWEYLDEIEAMKPCLIHSAGFLVDDAEDYKTIALGLSETQVLGRTTIPVCCIKSITKLATSSFSCQETA